ncbi:MAG: hypothetical protein Q9161_003700 [Pseudevernia consocians]
MSGDRYGTTKPMPLLAALAKNPEPQVDGVESGASKVEQKRAHEQEKGDTPRYFGLGAVTKPMPQKGRFKVLETHSERVESTLEHYYEDMAGQEEETGKYSRPRPRAKRLSRKRSFEESRLSRSDDSISTNWRAAVIGGQLGAKVKSLQPGKAPATNSVSQYSSDKVLSKGPSPARGSNSQFGSDMTISEGPSPARGSNSQFGSDMKINKGPLPARDSESQTGSDMAISEGPSPVRQSHSQTGSDKAAGTLRKR